MIHVSILVPARTGLKLTLSWPEPGYKQKTFARKIMVLNSTRVKNDGCSIPPRLSAYNHLGRKQITSNSSSDGLPEIDVQAEAGRYTDTQKMWH